MGFCARRALWSACAASAAFLKLRNVRQIVRRCSATKRDFCNIRLSVLVSQMGKAALAAHALQSALRARNPIADDFAARGRFSLASAREKLSFSFPLPLWCLASVVKSSLSSSFSNYSAPSGLIHRCTGICSVGLARPTEQILTTDCVTFPVNSG